MDQRGCRHENLRSSLYFGCPVRLRRLPLPARRDRPGVRWYLRFGLSYRDIEELLAERGVEVDHVTIYRWVLRFTPLLADAARPCRHALGDRWQVDETHVKVAGQWRCVYRAVDQFGQVVDVPTPGKPLFQAAAANLNPWTEAKVDTKNPDRGPLLFISGELDHTVPWAIVNASYKQQQDNPGVAEIEKLPGRGHALIIDSGWRDVADTALAFVQRFT